MKAAVLGVCRMLIASIMFLSFHTAHAGMIGTSQMIAAPGGQAQRGELNTFPGRADVARELEALGIGAGAAEDRVAAMTDQEVRALAGQVDTVAAGGSHGFWILLAAVVIGLALWWRGALPSPPR